MEKAERTLRERLQMLAHLKVRNRDLGGADVIILPLKIFDEIKALAREAAEALDTLYELERQRLAFTGDFRDPQVEIPIYDREEIHHNCTVQVLRNSITGQTSVGWWKEEEHVSE